MKKNPPRKSRRKTPTKVALKDYDDLKREILLQLQLNSLFCFPTASPSEDEHLALILSLRASDSQLSADDVRKKAATLWSVISSERLSENMTKRRRAALEKLLFSHGGRSIKFDLFLRRLLPRDRARELREQYFAEAMMRIPGTFVKFFQQGAGGWPESSLADVLKEDHSCFEPLVEVFRHKWSEGVSIEEAVIYAPFILAWREYRASPAMRGSMRHERGQEPQSCEQIQPIRSV